MGNNGEILPGRGRIQEAKNRVKLASEGSNQFQEERDLGFLIPEGFLILESKTGRRTPSLGNGRNNNSDHKNHRNKHRIIINMITIITETSITMKTRNLFHQDLHRSLLFPLVPPDGLANPPLLLSGDPQCHPYIQHSISFSTFPC